LDKLRHCTKFLYLYFESIGGRHTAAMPFTAIFPFT
jgi:hypothetical protein